MKESQIMENHVEMESGPEKEEEIHSAKEHVHQGVKEFLVLFEGVSSVEEKIQKAVAFMKECLSAHPKFREFWEVRKLCLPLFKESLSPKARAELWQQYVDLSVEAKRLKEILDEQSSFAYEQIDLAIQSLVKDLASYEELVAQMPEIEVPQQVAGLSGKKALYKQWQKELFLLNTLASKINALRKESIHTEMRIRNKNKLFDKLSECGNVIFPKRKSLVKILSEEFLKDVTQFASQHFVDDQPIQAPLHLLREEIKALQAFAKELTLNTQSFNQTRVTLSSCWDRVRVLDKEKKKEIHQKRLEQKQHCDAALEKIKSYEEFCKEEASLEKVESQYKILSQELQGMGINRFDLKALFAQMDLAKKPHEDRQRALQEERKLQEKKIEEERLQKVQEFKRELQALIEHSQERSLEEWTVAKQSLETQYKVLSFSKAERLVIDRLFKQLKDRILEVKSHNLLSLSASDQEQYENLIHLIAEKKERRAEIKHQIEAYRKALGGSGLDFEKAMMYQDLVESEKEALEKINGMIVELEKKLLKLEG